MDKMIIDYYLKNRKQEYADNIRGKYAKSVQSLHDMVRIGKVNRLSFPITVFWSITQYCNLECKHCYAHKYVNTEIDDLSLEDNIKIVDQLYENDVWEIVLQGGEPLCYKYINELLCYIKEKGISVTILTNGIKLCSETAEVINSKLEPVDLLQVSLDGYNDSNDFIRGSGIYKKVIHNLKSNISYDNIVINCVVTSKNLMSLDRMCNDLIVNTNVRKVHFSPLMEGGKYDIIKVPETEIALKVFNFIHEKYSGKLEISGSVVRDSMFLKDGDLYDIDFSKINLGCCAGRSKLYISNNGRLYMCDFMQDFNGIDTNNKDFKAIWTGNWENETQALYFASKKMKKEGRYTPFCPNI